MDQKKTGGFLKELRKEKGLTQEQLAEKFNVSDRTVSRWENGNNMPDLDILIEISDFYNVDLREILSGERKSENMDKETKETVLQAVDYTNTQAERCNKRIRICNGIGMLIFVAYMLLKDTDLYLTNHTVSVITDIAQGVAIGMVFTALVMSSRYGARVRAFKKRIFGRN